jgi:branched-chain amino acid transport system substrate-binding protein
VDYQRCDTHGACREAFGVGFACTDRGFCEQQLAPRCTRTHPVDYFENGAEYASYLPLGVIVNRSLDAHEARANAVQIVAELANAQGGFGARQRVAVVVCTAELNADLDDATAAEAAVSSAHWLHDVLGAPAIIGPASSSLAKTVFESLGERDVVLVSMSATSAELTELEPPATDDAPGRLWRTAVPDTFQARAIVADLRSRGQQRIAVVHQDDNYGVGLADELERDFTGAGEALERFSFSSDPRSALEAVASDATLAEVVFVGAVDHVRGFLQFVSGNTAFDGRQLFVTDTAASIDLFASPAAPDAVYARVRGTRPGAPVGSVNGFFRGSYLFAFQEDPDLFSFVANAYDAAFMTIYGAAWAEANDGSARSGRSIARGMRQLSDGAPIALGAATWPTALAELEAGRPIDLQGASGDLDVDPVTEEMTGDVEVWTIDTVSAPRIDVDQRYSAADLAALAP